MHRSSRDSSRESTPLPDLDHGSSVQNINIQFKDFFTTFKSKYLHISLICVTILIMVLSFFSISAFHLNSYCVSPNDNLCQPCPPNAKCDRSTISCNQNYRLIGKLCFLTDLSDETLSKLHKKVEKSKNLIDNYNYFKEINSSLTLTDVKAIISYNNDYSIRDDGLIIPAFFIPNTYILGALLFVSLPILVTLIIIWAFNK